MIQIRRSFSAKVVLWLLLIVLPIFLVTVGYLFMQTRKLVHTEAEAPCPSRWPTSRASFPRI